MLKSGTTLLRLSRGLFLSLAAVVVALSSCSTVKVQDRPSRVTNEGIQAARMLDAVATAPFAAIDLLAQESADLLKAAHKLEAKGQHVDAAGHFLKVAVDSRELLTSGAELPNSQAEQALIDLHDRALARFAELWSTDPRRQSPEPHRFHSEGQTFEIRHGDDTDFRGEFFDRAVAVEGIKGKGVVQKERSGYGAALVGVREWKPERADEMKFFPKRGLMMPVTLVMEDISLVGSGAEAHKVVSLSLLDPQKRHRLQLGDRSFPIAAHFSAPMEMLLDGKNEVLWGLSGFFEAAERIEESGIYLIEPYDPDRIPVILTHGLISVPIIWRDLIPELISEPDISERYQFMLFTYPSSYSIVESSHLFRSELAALREKYDPEGNDPLSHNMVAMGHSMGGVLTHMLVTDFGDHLWNQIADAPIDELPFTPEQKARAKELTYFSPDPAIRRTVFLSAPHRGAEMAADSLPGLLSRLVELPSMVLADTEALLTPDLIPHLRVDLSKKVTSIQSLRPDSPISLALDQAPYAERVNYHSIIGDRGKGDTPDSSDGIVEYWSSHQPGADSELIVPTGHGSYKHPNSIDEIKRILRLHAGLN